MSFWWGKILSIYYLRLQDTLDIISLRTEFLKKEVMSRKNVQNKRKSSQELANLSEKYWK